MILETNNLYHIYNQGNNRQKIFFNRDNYLFFLKKSGEYLLPYVDILAWCLMPNHFHFMVYVHDLEVEVADNEGFTQSEAFIKSTSEAFSKTPNKKRTLNDSIGLQLRSYTRAINKQDNRTGSLFRTPTKAECITKIEGITPSFFNTSQGTMINVSNPDLLYPKVCWDYIHNNPVEARIAKRPEDWEFSSYRDYYGLRNGKLINKERAKEFIEF
ncbi:MAG: transposase [Saprospiraceae bacterium]